MKKRLTARILALCMIMTLVACGSKDTDEQDPSTTKSLSAKSDLVVAIDREPQALDPTGSNHSITCTIVSQMYETLLEFDEKMNIVPCLAESYEEVDDTTLVFRLRKGVKFHNGEEMKASDVIFSLNRAASTPIGVAYTEKIDLASTKANDDYTVTIKLVEPYAAIKETLCISYLSILSEKEVNSVGEGAISRGAMAGTGPFKFESWTPGDNVTIIRNDDYWGEKARLEKVVYRFITEQTSRTIELESGGVDMAMLIPATDYERIRANENLELELYTSLYVRYIAFNVAKDSPLQNKLVRQALNWATDMDTMVSILYTDDGAQVSTGPVPPGLNGRNNNLKIYGYDVEKAKALLAEAGYPNGFDLTFTCLGNATNNMMGQMLQEMWKAVGVNLILNPLESGALSEYANGMKQEVMPVRTAYSIGDIGEGLEAVYHSKNRGTSRVNCANSELDVLLDEAAKTMDSNRRAELYEKAQEIIQDEAYCMNLCYEYTSIGHSSKLKGLTTPPTERTDYSKIYFEN